MSKNIVDNFGFFHLIPHCQCRKQLHQVLSHITKEQLNALGEIFVNILQGVLHVSKVLVKKLYKHRKLIEYLADSHHSKQKRKKVLWKQRKAVINILKLIYPIIKKIYIGWGK